MKRNHYSVLSVETLGLCRHPRSLTKDEVTFESEPVLRVALVDLFLHLLEVVVNEGSRSVVVDGVLVLSH